MRSRMHLGMRSRMRVAIRHEIHLRIGKSIHRSIHLAIRLHIRLAIGLQIGNAIHLRIGSSIRLLIRPAIHRSIGVSIRRQMRLQTGKKMRPTRRPRGEGPPQGVYVDASLTSTGMAVSRPGIVHRACESYLYVEGADNDPQRRQIWTSKDSRPRSGSTLTAAQCSKSCAGQW